MKRMISFLPLFFCVAACASIPVSLLWSFSGGTATGAVTAKSVVFDISDNWGSAYMTVRSIEFKLAGVLITNTTPTAYATTEYGGTKLVIKLFNTSLSKTGSEDYTSWSPSVVTNQRVIVVFSDITDFDSIVINNGHSSGGLVDRGAKNVKITSSLSTITDTTYNAVIPGGIFLKNSVWPEHSSVNAADDQIVWSGI